MSAGCGIVLVRAGMAVVGLLVLRLFLHPGLVDRLVALEGRVRGKMVCVRSPALGRMNVLPILRSVPPENCDGNNY